MRVNDRESCFRLFYHGPVTKLDKKNKTTLKKFDNSTTSGSCDVIVIFQICGQFGVIWRPYSGLIV